MRPKKELGFKSIAVTSANGSKPSPPRKKIQISIDQNPPKVPSPKRCSSLNAEHTLEKTLLSCTPEYASATIDETFRRLHFYRQLASLRLDDISLQDTVRVTIMLQETIQNAHNVLGADCIVLYTVQDIYLNVRASTAKDLIDTNHSLVQSIPGTLILQRSVPEDPLPVFVLNLQHHSKYHRQSDVDGRLGTQTHSYVAYPIVFNGSVEAVIELRSYKEQYYCPVLLGPFITAICNLLHPRFDSTAHKKQPLRSNLAHITKLLDADVIPKPQSPHKPSHFVANTALSQALKGVVQLTGADVATIFHVSHTTQIAMETATSNDQENNTDGSDYIIFTGSVDKKGPTFKEISQVLALYGPVETRQQLDIIQNLFSNSQILSAAVVVIHNPLNDLEFYTVVCISTTLASLTCESNVYKLVRAIMTSGCEIDRLSHSVDLLKHQKQTLRSFLSLTNEVWMNGDGGRKMQLLCLAGSEFFATKEFRLYVCDRVHEELWSFNSFGISSGKHIQFGEGIVGALVHTKKSMWLHDVQVDGVGVVTEYAIGYGTHACLVLPICNLKGDVIAVSQVLYKTFKTHLKIELSHVQNYDQVFLEIFTSAFSRILVKNPTLMMYAKVHADRERVAHLHQQAEAIKQHQRIYSLLASSGLQGTSITSTEIATFNLVAKAAGKFARLRVERLKPKLVASLAPEPQRFLTPLPDLINVDINVFEMTYNQLKVLLVQMFQSYHLLIAFSIDTIKFTVFLDEVVKGYRDLPYHNFYHAFTVTQFVYFLLSGDKMQSITELDAFGVLIAALGHDLDHPGNDNSFEVATSSELAIRYNDTSVLESHATAMLFRILRDGVGGLLDGFESSKYRAIRTIVIQCILHTDMKYHADLIALGTERTDVKALEAYTDGKQLYLNWILHSSDLGVSGLSPPRNQLWVERVYQEFRDQARRMRDLNLNVAPHHMHLENEQVRNILQVNFLDFVVLPLWTLTSQLLPHSKPILDQMQSNREYFYNATLDKDEIGARKR
ncbi:3'5'-cyclic nucleotide phosphodiesterase [Thraustotheca clavata]|uniref:Phosphodiesterase n=1 Tax=Thraustotheca clavata TaxID=74557 RepID=A0A1V9ZYQ7_9STRA|nr:3'5'-cyclic nucleotide phosphodiesterase [Thraustotheca clavata]